MFVAWSVNFPDEAGTEATPAAGGPSSPAVTERPADPAAQQPVAQQPVGDAPQPATTQPAATQPRPASTSPADRPTTSTDAPRAPSPQSTATAAAPGNKLLVLVYGEVGANMAEEPILRSLGGVSGVTVVDAPAAAMMRRDPGASRATAQGDFPALVETARRNGIEYVVLGQLESSASSLRGNMYSGSAQLGLRMYRVSTGQVIDQGTFTTGMGSDPAVPGRNELAARTGAAQAVGRLGAGAARRWLTSALRN
jgi:hypothetical protein